MSELQPQNRLTSEDVAKAPPGIGSVPLSIKFSPDESKVTYLYPDESGARQVFAVDLNLSAEVMNIPEISLSSPPALTYEPYRLIDANSKGTDSLEEQLRKERMRMFISGVSSYEWSTRDTSPAHEDPLQKQQQQQVMIPLHGSVWLHTDKSGSSAGARPQLLYDSAGSPCSDSSSSELVTVLTGPAIDPQVSPDGTKVAFVVNDDLYVCYISASSTGAINTSSSDSSKQSPLIRRLTFNGAVNGVSCGVADFIAQEEMDRYQGFWWSPCSSMIAYTETDERHIPEYSILHQGKDDPEHKETHRYPFAGKYRIIRSHLLYFRYFFRLVTI